jgi:hypothetical protein
MRFTRVVALIRDIIRAGRLKYRPGSRWGLALAVCYLLPAVGCSGGKEVVVDAYRTSAQATLQVLDGVMADARQRPPLEEEYLDGPATEVIFLDVLNEEEEANAAMIFLRNYEQPPDHPRSFYDDVPYVDRWWFWPTLALRGVEAPLDSISARSLRRSFETLARLRFVLVLRAQEWVAPSAATEVGESGLFHFTKGRFTGEALLYSLEDARFWGGVQVAATNQDHVTNLSGATLEDVLRSDLLAQIQQTALLNLARHLPSLRIPRLHR